MFEQARMLYLYVETSLHAGSGSSVGVVDLPIQRERVTNYPVIQASGIKGKLRAEADEKLKKQGVTKAEREEKIRIVFGPETGGGGASDHAGALAPGDARLLLFPVRSLVGVFSWTTSRTALERFRRDLQAAGSSVPWTLANLPDNNNAWTVDTISVVTGGNTVVLEEYAFPATSHADVGTIADWLANNALPAAPSAGATLPTIGVTTATSQPAAQPQGAAAQSVPMGGNIPPDEYRYFREQLKQKLIILPEDAFRDFTQFATEVLTRVRIDPVKKTVMRGALWTEEHLPSDTLLYTPLHATRPRADTALFNDAQGKPAAAKVLDFLSDLNLDRLQLGGDETVGRGIVKLRFGV